MGSACPHSWIIIKKPIGSAVSNLSRHNTSNRFSLSLLKKNSSMVYCQGSGNLRNSNGRPPLITVRSTATITEDNMVFLPNGKAQDDMGIMELMAYNERALDSLENNEGGIEIVRFLKGKQFLITGGTGFLAKVLIEKILRTTPDVGKIYVLIKAKDKDVALERLKFEVINTDLFRTMKQIHGKNYQEFILKKLVAVVGNIRESNIGIEPELADEISEEVDVIVNSAANTTFDERYDVALDINTIGPCRIMSFAQRFKKLQLFLQVSTAYVNGQRQGTILEKPFCIGDTIAREMTPSNSSVKTMPFLDIESRIKLAFEYSKNVSQDMKELGLKRAKIHGWQDTYVFTKAMGEMVINSLRGDVPMVTIRPSVIESTCKEPFPGWMEGNRMMDPIVLYYGKGQLSGFLADPNGVLDVVPVDMVVNAMLVAIAKHGVDKRPGMHIYHVASSLTNPLVFQHLARLIYEHFNTSPCVDSKGKSIVVPQMKFFSNMKEFSSYIQTDIIEKSKKVSATISNEKLFRTLQNLCLKSVEQAKHLANIYEPYTFYGGSFLVTIMGLLIPWSATLAVVDIYSIIVGFPLRLPGVMVIVVVGDWVMSILSLGAACATAGVVDRLLHIDGTYCPPKYCVLNAVSWGILLPLQKARM